MNIRQLRIFLAVVDNEGVGRAASALFMAQPAVSQTLRQMERHFRAALFERMGRRIVLTEAGEALVGPARRILRDLDIAEEAVASVRSLEFGTMRVTSLPSLSLDPLPELLATFCRRHPNIYVKAAVDFDTAHVLEAVRSATADIGLTTELDLERVEGLATKRIGSQELTLAFPPGIPVPTSAEAALELLQELPFVAAIPGTRTRALLDTIVASGIKVRVVAEVMNREMVVLLITKGVGCGIVASPYTERIREAGGTIVSLSPPHTVPVHAVYRRGATAPATSAFLAIMAGEPAQDDRPDDVSRP